MEDNIFSILQTKKVKDFCDWSIIMIIVIYGYNRLPEGISIINQLKNGMNNFRLTTNSKFTAGIAVPSLKLDNQLSINLKVSDLFSLPTPYVIKDGIRYLISTNNLV